ncbi:MAG: tyrosine--tRNA ligase [Acidobacteria bacterium]|nr:tyrosine--tRNA ligase [Acidobacteriota bacterium]
MTGNVWDEFEWRGMIYEATEGAREALARPLTCYIGFDPTASSLHVGSLLPLMALARLQRFGHSPIAIAGGGTGMIGDPSGKTQERQLLDLDRIEENVAGIRRQLERFLDFDARPNPARIVNNADWLAKLDLMTFLRDTGKHFTVNYMLAKESVRRRLESEDGISYTEFSYLMLQSYDYLQLFDRYGCTLQLGGSDQWGNITAGCDLIRKLRGTRVHGVVLPLVTTTAGVKFGKTEAGAVWLDAARTSPFRFYQFWLNTDDGDVGRYLRYFTFLDREAIEALEGRVRESPERREAQRELAREVTRLLHGDEGLARAERATSVLFGGDLSELGVDEVLEVFDDVPSTELGRAELEGGGKPVTDLLVLAGLSASKGEAARLVRQGGVYLNNRRVEGERERVTAERAIGGTILVLRKGARQNHVLRIR